MRFLKTLFWLLLGGVAAAFVIYNGDQRVTILLWGGLIADSSLPVLLILVFLAGLLPMLLAYHALKWRMKQRLAGLERALDDLRAVQSPYSPESPAPSPAPPLLPESP
ncbi:MAG: LapA family protein [Sphingomonas sp.]